MKRFFAIALLATGMGMTLNAAALQFAPAPVMVCEESGEMDPALVEQILRAVSLETGIDAAELESCFACGELTITKVPEGYEVAFMVDGGGAAIIIAGDNA